MAERRMFAKKVVTSARFLRMPSTAQLLYFQLGMQADDDGVVEAFTVMRTTGSTDDDLLVLVDKGFIAILNDDLVAYIGAWKQNNQIRPDRYKPSMYADLLEEYLKTKQPNENQRYPHGIPNDNQRYPQVSVGECSQGEGNTGEYMCSQTAHKQTYGEFQNVLLTDDELEKLKAAFPADWKERIESLSSYMKSTGKKYENHYATLKRWEMKENQARPIIYPAQGKPSKAEEERIKVGTYL